MKNGDLLQQWLAESPKNQRSFLEEGLIMDATEAICEAMENRDLSKAVLAERLGSSKAHVTQLLNGSRNMTLRTFARIAFALEVKPSIGLQVSVAPGATTWHKSESKIVVYPNRRTVPALILAPSGDWRSARQYGEAA